MSNWKTVKLGDLFTFKNGLNKGVEFFGHGTPIVNYMDVNKNNFLIKESIKGLVDVTKSELANCGTQKGDVFFTRTSETLAEIGLSSVLMEDIDDCVFSGYVLRARPSSDQLIPKYCAYSLRTSSIRKEIMRKSSMTTRALTNGKFLADVDFALPGKTEQTQIVSILEIWDEYLEKLDRTIELKKSIKKGLMQQLLSGKKRLPGFNEHWAETTLGELYKITSSKRVFESDWKHEGVPFYRAREIIKLRDNGYVDNELFIAQEMFEEYTDKYGSVKRDDILVTGVGTVGVAFRVQDFTNFYFKDGNIIWLKSLGKASSAYVEQVFKSDIIKRQIHLFTPITTVATYTIEMANSTKLLLPPRDEQDAISEILAIADQEIADLKQVRLLVKKQKDFLLEKLTSGKIRTPESFEAKNKEIVNA